MIQVEELAELIVDKIEQSLQDVKKIVSKYKSKAAAQETRQEMPDFANKALIASVLEEVFWTTLLTEEGRPCKLRLVVADSEVRERSILFEEPCRCNSKMLRDLAFAHDHEKGGIVWETVDGRTARLVGLLEPSEDSTRALCIEARAPGCFDVMWQGRLLIRCLGRDYESSENAKTFTQKTLRDIFLAGTVLGKTGGDENVSTDIVLNAARFILDEGHGGSLWVVKEKEEGEITVGFPTNDSRGGVKRTTEPSQENSIKPRKKEIAARGNMIAALAGVDGAVLLNADAKILGFSTFIELTKDLEVCQALPDGEPTGPQKAEAFGGGRHRAAIQFCTTHENAVAFVVSEDRKVRVVRSKHGDEKYPVIAELSLSVYE